MLTSDNSHSAPRAVARKTPRQRRARETVDRICEAAAHLFDQRGYRATTTNHVAEAAGVSIGSLYQYFPNKDALLVELADRHLAAAMADLTEVAIDARRDDDLETALTRLFRAALDANQDPLHRLMWTAPRTPELIERFDAAEDVMVAEVEWHLCRAGWPASASARRARLIVVAAGAAVHDPVLASEPDALVADLVAVSLAR